MSQYENTGEAIHAQAAAGYDYGGGSSLAEKDFKYFNREQQGDIIKDYYINVVHGFSSYTTEYERMQQLVKGEL